MGKQSGKREALRHVRARGLQRRAATRSAVHERHGFAAFCGARRGDEALSEARLFAGACFRAGVKVTPFSPRCAWRVPVLVTLGLLGLARIEGRGVEAPPGFAGVLLERGYLPEAKPNAFAVGFAEGVSFCFDPVRGGLNYAWTGGFVDVAPIRPGMGKTVAPVTLLGEVVYREGEGTPWRVGRADRVPAVRFRGYSVAADRIEFVYTLDGLEVREQIVQRGGSGLVRRFVVLGEGGPVWFRPEAALGAVAVRGAAAEAGGHRLDGAGRREFTVEVTFGGIRR